ncbi:hypothetical protein [Streptomyces massasporeus]|uniref:hypothetical protein n=1 Tax=Streptomyces massasporeus TaxID=67324 RepID=UPI00380B55AE
MIDPKRAGCIAGASQGSCPANLTCTFTSQAQRRFGAMEDVVLGRLEESGRQIAVDITARPQDERPCKACVVPSTRSPG